MECSKKNCSTCLLSEWTEWSECTNKCNGVSKRFRKYYGINCNKNTTEEDVKQCQDCSCTIDDITYEV